MDHDHAAALVYEIERTAAGCQWLLDQWAELRAVSDQGHAWNWPQQYRALRLLGKDNLDDRDDPIVAAVLSLRSTVPVKKRDAQITHGEGDNNRNETDLDRLDEVVDTKRRPVDRKGPSPKIRASAAASAVDLPALIARTVARLEDLARGHR